MNKSKYLYPEPKQKTNLTENETAPDWELILSQLSKPRFHVHNTENSIVESAKRISARMFQKEL